jgi:branched-chain amino acid transport system permease protein
VTTAALIHVVVSGLATGCIYALMALSLVIIYNATRTLNFAQGEMLMISTFMAWTAQRAFGLPLLATLGVAVVAAAALAFVFERLVIRRAIGATHWDVLIITLGLSLALQAGAGLAWTHDQFPFPSFFSNRPVALGPVRLAPASLGIIGASLAIMLALVALFRWTRLGRAMRAVAQNQRAARLMGISVERVYSLAWVLAAVVGAIVGVLVAPVIFLSSKMGLIVLVEQNARAALALASRGYVLETGRVVAAAPPPRWPPTRASARPTSGSTPPRSDGPPGYDADWRREGAP